MPDPLLMLGAFVLACLASGAIALCYLLLPIDHDKTVQTVEQVHDSMRGIRDSLAEAIVLPMLDFLTRRFR